MKQLTLFAVTAIALLFSVEVSLSDAGQVVSERVPGLILLGRNSDVHSARGQIVLLKWGINAGSVSAFGLKCAGDETGGAGMALTGCQALEENGQALQIPGTDVKGQGLVIVSSKGLFQGTLWLDSAEKLAAARVAIKRLSGGSQTRPQLLGSSDTTRQRDIGELYYVDSVALAISGYGSRPGGQVVVTYGPFAPPPNSGSPPS